MEAEERENPKATDSGTEDEKSTKATKKKVIRREESINTWNNMLYQNFCQLLKQVLSVDLKVSPFTSLFWVSVDLIT